MPEEEKNLAASRQILCFPFLPHFSGAAQIPPAGKIPFVGKIPALAGFNGINPAAVFRQHHAGSVFRVPAIDNPRRLALNRQHVSIKTCSSMFRKREISWISSVSMHTSPAQRQHAPHLVHSYRTAFPPFSIRI